ncbi:MAG: GDSL-type esterase/lipase family protein [Sporolactobacillus sp.]
MSDRLLYTAIGDSLTFGIGSTVFQPNFVKLYREAVEYHFQCSVERRTFAKNGAVAEQILAQLSRPETAEAVAASSFITLTAGGNDMLHASRQWLKSGDGETLYQSINQCVRVIEAILATIFQIHAADARPFCVRLVNLYNPIAQIPGSYAWLDYYNRQIATLERSPMVKIADVYHAFLGREEMLLSFDHIHPNPLGYRIMADTAIRLGYQPVG